MIPFLVRYLGREVRGLHEAAYLLGAFSLVSAVLALFRDRLFAHTFGAGELLDVYNAAFRIPDVLFVVFASLVSVFVLVPIIAQKEKDDAQHLVGNVIVLFSGMLLIAAGILFFALPSVLSVMFPELYNGTYGSEFVLLSRLLLVQPLLLGLSGVLASVAQAHARYHTYALAPLLYNAGIIFGVVFLYPALGIAGLGWGVVLGALAHFLVQVPFVWHSGYLRFLGSRIRWKETIQLFAISLPRTIALSANHFALLFLVALAATLGSGSVAVLTFALNIQSVPLSMIGASYSTAAFPALARFYAAGNMEEFVHHVRSAVRHIIFWAFPIIALVVVLRAHIVRLILGSGAFSWDDTRLVAAALGIFVVSLAAQSLSLVFVRAYYAAGKTLTPLIVNGITAGLSVVLALWFVSIDATHPVWHLFWGILTRTDDIAYTSVLMVPLAISIAALLNALIFITLPFLRHMFWALSRTLFESFSAAVIAAFVTRIALNQLVVLFGDAETFVTLIAHAGVASIAGIGASIATLWVLQSRELKEVHAATHHWFNRYIPFFGSDVDKGL